jgi:hypothetical protein
MLNRFFISYVRSSIDAVHAGRVARYAAAITPLLFPKVLFIWCCLHESFATWQGPLHPRFVY